MINLNTYIIEKLKINKDTELSHQVKVGDFICALNIYHSNKDSKELELSIHEPFKVEEINNDTLKYKVEIKPLHGNPYEKMIEQNIYKNSKGFLQDSDYKNVNYRRGVYLEKTDAIEFLKRLLKRNIDNVDLVHDYFDHLDCFDFNQLDFVITDRTGDSKYQIKTNGIKRIIELYENT